MGGRAGGGREVLRCAGVGASSSSSRPRPSSPPPPPFGQAPSPSSTAPTRPSACASGLITCERWVPCLLLTARLHVLPPPQTHAHSLRRAAHAAPPVPPPATPCPPPPLPNLSRAGPALHLCHLQRRLVRLAFHRCAWVWVGWWGGGEQGVRLQPCAHTPNSPTAPPPPHTHPPTSASPWCASTRWAPPACSPSQS